MKNQQPNWQPITMLPDVVDILDNTNIQKDYQQLHSLRKASVNPKERDDYQVYRVIRDYSERLKVHNVIYEQLSHWAQDKDNTQALPEIDRLKCQVNMLKDMAQNILILARNLDDEMRTAQT